MYNCVLKMCVLHIKIDFLPLFFGFSEQQMLQTYILRILFRKNAEFYRKFPIFAAIIK